jgi:hypothetical protein
MNSEIDSRAKRFEEEISIANTSVGALTGRDWSQG